MDSKINQNFVCILSGLWSQRRAILVQVMGHFVPNCPNLDPTWNQLGPNMAPKCGCCGALVGPKIVQKTIKTVVKCIDRFLNDFSLILDKCWLKSRRFFVDFGLIFRIQVVLKSIKHQSDADLRRSTQLGECPWFLLRN